MIRIGERTGTPYVCDPDPRERGGQARVFRAEDPDGRVLAIKVALEGHDDPLQREVHQIIALSANLDLAPRIVPVVDQGWDADGRFFLVMPWRTGRLDRWWIERPLDDRIEVAEALAHTIVLLQRAAVVHCDVKPTNVYVETRGDGAIEVQLADFATARSAQSEGSDQSERPDQSGRTVPEAPCGWFSAGYSPLDAALADAGRPDPTWDSHALAATVFEILVGHTPAQVRASYEAPHDAGDAHLDTPRAEDRRALAHTLDRELMEVAPGVNTTAMATRWSAALGEAIEGALHPDPPRRDPEDAAQLHRVLHAARIEIDQPGPTEPAPLPQRGRRWGLAGLATLAVLAVSASVPDPRFRDVHLQALGVPDGSSIRATIGGRNADDALVVADLPLGSHDMSITGRFDGRCPWEHRGTLRLHAGLGAQQVSLTPSVPACPSAEIGYPMVRVPGGGSVVGPAHDEWYRDQDEPLKRVVQDPFLLGRTEVTQSLWRAVTGADPVSTLDATGGGPCASYQGIPQIGDALPVVCVSWCDAIAFANQMSRLEGLTPVYTAASDCEAGGAVDWDRAADGWRLPTEAEWEHAARAGVRHPLIAGDLDPDDAGRCAAVTDYGNVADLDFAEALPHKAGNGSVDVFYDPTCELRDALRDGFVGIAPVGRFRPNAWGLSDLTGNVREWTFDRYDEAREPGLRTIRGSAFNDGAMYLRLANRGADRPHRRTHSVGLRLARNAQRGLP